MNSGLRLSLTLLASLASALSFSASALSFPAPFAQPYPVLPAEAKAPTPLLVAQPAIFPAVSEPLIPSFWATIRPMTKRATDAIILITLCEPSLFIFTASQTKNIATGPNISQLVNFSVHFFQAPPAPPTFKLGKIANTNTNGNAINKRESHT